MIFALVNHYIKVHNHYLTNKNGTKRVLWRRLHFLFHWMLLNLPFVKSMPSCFKVKMNNIRDISWAPAISTNDVRRKMDYRSVGTNVYVLHVLIDHCIYEYIYFFKSRHHTKITFIPMIYSLYSFDKWSRSLNFGDWFVKLYIVNI